MIYLNAVVFVLFCIVTAGLIASNSVRPVELGMILLMVSAVGFTVLALRQKATAKARSAARTTNIVASALAGCGIVVGLIVSPSIETLALHIPSLAILALFVFNARRLSH